jgi:hypothetical protein
MMQRSNGKMQGAVLMLLYALSAWGAVLNFPAWGRLVWLRWIGPRDDVWHRDNILLVRAGLTVLSFGISGLAGARLIGAAMSKLPITVPSPIGILFIGSMALAEPMFLRVDENHLNAIGTTHSWRWLLYWSGTAAIFLSFAAYLAMRGRT